VGEFLPGSYKKLPESGEFLPGSYKNLSASGRFLQGDAKNLPDVGKFLQGDGKDLPDSGKFLQGDGKNSPSAGNFLPVPYMYPLKPCKHCLRHLGSCKDLSTLAIFWWTLAYSSPVRAGLGEPSHSTDTATHSHSFTIKHFFYEWHNDSGIYLYRTKQPGASEAY
jgi:hypothetical protein